MATYMNNSSKLVISEKENALKNKLDLGVPDMKKGFLRQLGRITSFFICSVNLSEAH